MKTYLFILITTLFSLAIPSFFCALFAQTEQPPKERKEQIDMKNLLKSDSVKFNYGNTDFLIDMTTPIQQNDSLFVPKEERSGSARNIAEKLDTTTVKKTVDNSAKHASSPIKPQKEPTANVASPKTDPNPKPTTISQTTTTQPNPSMPTSSKPAITTNKVSNNYTYVIRNPENIIPQKKLIDKPIVNYPKGANGTDAATYKARLSALPTIIAMDYNDLVAGFIKMYLNDKRDQVSRMLSRSDNYMTIFETTLDRYGLPLELAYLPVIESALVPHAKNDRGASGLWQLPYNIAKQYGLETNNYIDERRDPGLSSEVAAQYLSYLYKKYTDWHLVIAAYNCGEGAVNKAIKQAGGQRNYWDLSPFLSIEAQAYVPLFIAAVYVMNYYPEHNIYKHDAPYKYYTTDTIRVKNGLNLKGFALNVSMEYDELVFLNPAITHDTIPPSKRGYPIVLPISKLGVAAAYINNLDPNADVYIDRTKEKDITLPLNNNWRSILDAFGNPINGKNNDNYSHKANNNYEYNKKQETKPKTNSLDYYVQNGDVLSSIAQKFDCTSDEIQKWNKLKEVDKLRPFQKLQVWVPTNEKFSTYENIALQSVQLDEKTIQKANKKVREYTVKQGDTLWKIAEKFKVEAEQLKKYNGIKSTTLKPGSILKIPE